MILMLLFIALFFYIVINNAVERKKRKVNPYIEVHQKKMNDDKMYDEYLEFCKSNGELPMEKSGFQELRMKEDKMKEKINNVIR